MTRRLDPGLVSDDTLVTIAENVNTIIPDAIARLYQIPYEQLTSDRRLHGSKCTSRIIQRVTHSVASLRARLIAGSSGDRQSLMAARNGKFARIVTTHIGSFRSVARNRSVR